MAKDIVVLIGLRETIADLKKFDKSAVNKFTKVINTELRGMKKEAIDIAVQASTHGEYQNAPLSNWQTTRRQGAQQKGQKRPFPIWEAGEVISNIGVSKAQGKVRKNYTTSAGALINGSAAGRIFELAGAGKRNRNPSASSTAFKRNLTNRFGQTGRLVFRVLDKNGERVQKKVYDALEVAKADLQKALQQRETK